MFLFVCFSDVFGFLSLLLLYLMFLLLYLNKDYLLTYNI